MCGRGERSRTPCHHPDSGLLSLLHSVLLTPVVPVLHYFPALVCLTSIKATKDPLGSKMIAAAAPAVLFNVYTRVLDPSDVYGVPIQPAVAAGIGTAYGVLAALAVWYTERGSRI